MNPESKTAVVGRLDRINLRLTAETFAEIDGACAARAGSVSRNTWVAEAVQEKLARAPLAAPAPSRERRAHG
jgi:predicted HicB family RNase H-like nuclease